MWFLKNEKRRIDPQANRKNKIVKISTQISEVESPKTIEIDNSQNPKLVL